MVKIENHFNFNWLHLLLLKINWCSRKHSCLSPLCVLFSLAFILREFSGLCFLWYIQPPVSAQKIFLFRTHAFGASKITFLRIDQPLGKVSCRSLYVFLFPYSFWDLEPVERQILGACVLKLALVEGSEIMSDRNKCGWCFWAFRGPAVLESVCYALIFSDSLQCLLKIMVCEVQNVLNQVARQGTLGRAFYVSEWPVLHGCGTTSSDFSC